MYIIISRHTYLNQLLETIATHCFDSYIHVNVKPKHKIYIFGFGLLLYIYYTYIKKNIELIKLHCSFIAWLENSLLNFVPLNSGGYKNNVLNGSYSLRLKTHCNQIEKQLLIHIKLTNCKQYC